VKTKNKAVVNEVFNFSPLSPQMDCDNDSSPYCTFVIHDATYRVPAARVARAKATVLAWLMARKQKNTPPFKNY
jgi:hypothetical protein